MVLGTNCVKETGQDYLTAIKNQDSGWNICQGDTTILQCNGGLHALMMAGSDSLIELAVRISFLSG